MQVRRLLRNLIAMLLLAGCSRHQVMVISTPLFIKFPASIHVFDNVAPILYEAVHQQLIHSGFAVVHNPNHAYTLEIVIKSLDPYQKNISPDVILLSYRLRMVYTIRLLNYQQKELFNHQDTCAILVTKPRDPMLNDTFMHHAYQALANRAARLIQQQLIKNNKYLFD